MSHPLINDPLHWRRRAQDVRNLAETEDDEAAKQALLRLATNYEQLATQAEARRTERKPIGCGKCKGRMNVARVKPHSRFADLEEWTYTCQCGNVTRRFAPRVSDSGAPQ